MNATMIKEKMAWLASSLYAGFSVAIIRIFFTDSKNRDNSSGLLHSVVMLHYNILYSSLSINSIIQQLDSPSQ